MPEKTDFTVSLLELESVGSTNRYALEQSDSLADFTLVTADTQNAGRGRLGRVWVSPPGVNFYGSWLLKSWPHPPSQATWLGSLALLDTIAELVPEVKPWIKWPNDAWIGNRKLCGMLAECRPSPGLLPVLVLGIGVNVNLSGEALTAISPPATSLYEASKRKINRKKFAQTLAIHLMRWYLIAVHSGTESLFSAWKTQNRLIGEAVAFTEPDGKVRRGVVRDVTFDGEIVLETSDGCKSFQCGDVVLDKMSFPNFS